MAHLSDEDRAELVAYLDGELDDRSAQEFEARLTRDKQLRAEAEVLKKTWELLDFLPRAEPSTGFTHRTLERIAVRETALAPGVSRPRRWFWAAPAAWAAAMFIAVLGGLAGGLYFSRPSTPPPPSSDDLGIEAQIIHDLDVIRNMRLYENVDDVDFLRSLARTFNDDGGMP